MKENIDELLMKIFDLQQRKKRKKHQKNISKYKNVSFNKKQKKKKLKNKNDSVVKNVKKIA